MTTLAIIPARGGSVGVKNKNIRRINDKPLICHAIDAARNASCLDRIIVSTDSDEIGRIAREYGAAVPFMRPDGLARSDTNMVDTIRHAVVEFERIEKIELEIVVVLQPTTPLRRGSDIDGAVSLLQKNPSSHSVITCHRVQAGHPFYMYDRVAGEDHRFTPLLPDVPQGGQRQDYRPVYLRNGVVYAARRDLLVNEGKLFTAETLGHEIPEERSINIDSELDLRFAKFLMETGQ